MFNKRFWFICPLLCICVGIIVVFAFIYWYPPQTTVLLVRHAEKANVPGADPPLSPAGEARAQNLIVVAGDAGVTVTYATQFNRTQQTAQPLADHLNLPVTVFNVNDAQQYAEDLAAEILSQHSGKVVFVASHSNTVPLIVDELGASPVQLIGENEYDNLFIVTVPKFLGGVRIIRAKYGSGQ